jgi:hypothetical protein
MLTDYHLNRAFRILKRDNFINNEFYRFYFFKICNPSGLPISPHLRCQISSRIGDYSEKTSSPAERDFALLNLLICGNLDNRST